MRALLAACCSLLCAPSSLAEPVPARNEAPVATEPGRYAITPSDGGFLRLDTQTGSVSFCRVEDGHALCRAGADEKAALEAEISRLRRENTELRNSLSGSATAQPKGTPGLPSEEEFERTLSMTERFLRRIMKVLREEAPAEQGR